MREGRIPAHGVTPLKDVDTISSNRSKTRADSMHDDAHCQQSSLPFGNKCGHVPWHPNFPEYPKHHKKRFPLLREAQKRFADSYFHPLRFAIGQIFYDEDKHNPTGSYRKRRSELREALTCRIGHALFHCVNLANMALGKVAPNGIFLPYSVKYLATLANVSLSRARRALEVFKDFGYINILERKYKSHDGRWLSENSIITVSAQLFYDLDFTEADLMEYQKKQTDKADKENLIVKSKEVTKEQRASKKVQKKHMQNIREILAKATNKQSLTVQEREALDQEMPGWERRLERKDDRSMYRDYTGCSQDQTIYQQNEPRSLGNLLGHVLDHAKKIKDPP